MDIASAGSHDVHSFSNETPMNDNNRSRLESEVTSCLTGASHARPDPTILAGRVQGTTLLDFRSGIICYVHDTSTPANDYAGYDSCSLHMPVLSDLTSHVLHGLPRVTGCRRCFAWTIHCCVCQHVLMISSCSLDLAIGLAIILKQCFGMKKS